MPTRSLFWRAWLAACVALALLLPGLRLVGADGPAVIQEIKDGDGGVAIKDHVTSIVAVGDHVYAGIEYQGLIQCFKRDAASGKLTWVSKTEWGGAHDSIELCLAGGRLYGVGGAGHRTGDGDSRGLHMWEIDLKTGALTEKHQQKVPIAKGILAAPDGKSLYVLYKQKATIAHFTLAADGTPTHADDGVFKDVKGEISALTASADGKSLYVLWAGDTYVAGHAAAGAGGALAVQPSLELPQLTEGVTFDRKKWGWGWGRSIFLSPDGLHAYVEFCTYGGKDIRLALCDRDPKTGSLAYKQRVDDKTGATMVRLDAVFEPEGAKGYFVSSSESSGNVAGWFTREPKSGLLTFGGAVKETKGSGPCCVSIDAKNGALYVGSWSKKNIYVLKTK